MAKGHYILSQFLIVVLLLGYFLFIYSGNEPEMEYVEEVEMSIEKFMTIEYKWERAFREDCRYDVFVHGFKALHTGNEDHISSIVLVEDCDLYEKGDTLIINEK